MCFYHKWAIWVTQSQCSMLAHYIVVVQLIYEKQSVAVLSSGNSHVFYFNWYMCPLKLLTNPYKKVHVSLGVLWFWVRFWAIEQYLLKCWSCEHNEWYHVPTTVSKFIMPGDTFTAKYDFIFIGPNFIYGVLDQSLYVNSAAKHTFLKVENFEIYYMIHRQHTLKYYQQVWYFYYRCGKPRYNISPKMNILWQIAIATDYQMCILLTL